MWQNKGEVMQKHELLKSQKNEVFNAIEGVLLNPADFEWQSNVYRTPEPPNSISSRRRSFYEENVECPVLVYRYERKFFFQFELHDKYHVYKCCPGANTPEEINQTGQWNSQIQQVANWAYRLRNEIEAPDLWEEMSKYQIVLSPETPESGANEPFSWTEAEEIKVKLEQFGDKIRSVYQLNTEQDTFVRNKLKYLEDSAKRFGKKDWIFLALGVFPIIGKALEMTPDQWQQMLLLIKGLFGSTIHFLQ